MTNRELASAILLTLLLCWGLTRPDARKALLTVVRTFVHWRIQLPLALYMTFVGTWVWLVSGFGLWNKDLLTETVLWFVLSGFPVLLQVNDAGRNPRHFWSVIRETFSLGALFVFFVNLSSLSLVGELVLQLLLAFVVGMRVVSAHDSKQAQIRRVLDIILSLVLIAMLIYTATDLTKQRKAVDGEHLLLSLLMTFWLPLVSMMFLYGFALFAGYESAFVRMRFGGKEMTYPSIKAKVALLVGLNFRLRDVYAFGGGCGGHVKSASSFHAALEEVREFRRQRQSRVDEERQTEEKLRRYAGVEGVDGSGKQLDRREFTETQNALRWIATCHIGWYQNRHGSYRPDLMNILGDLSFHGLPGNHGIKMYVRGDGQAWYAWRRTVSGWVFAIGAASAPPDQWLYDGLEPPASFPEAYTGWDHFAPRDKAINW